MRFSLFNTKIYVSFLFLSLICLFLLIDKTGLFLPMLTATFFHEFGHLFCMWIFGCQPKEINLIPGSVQIVSSYCSAENKNILIMLSGPFANLLIFFILFLNYCFFGDDSHIVFAFVNLLLGVFNLLPIKGLDGGTVLQNIITSKYNEKTANMTLNVISVIAACVLGVTAILLSVAGKTNLSAYILSVYLILSVLLKF